MEAVKIPEYIGYGLEWNYLLIECDGKQIINIPFTNIHHYNLQIPQTYIDKVPYKYNYINDACTTDFTIDIVRVANSYDTCFKSLYQSIDINNVQDKLDALLCVRFNMFKEYLTSIYKKYILYRERENTNKTRCRGIKGTIIQPMKPQQVVEDLEKKKIYLYFESKDTMLLVQKILFRICYNYPVFMHLVEFTTKKPKNVMNLEVIHITNVLTYNTPYLVSFNCYDTCNVMLNSLLA